MLESMCLGSNGFNSCGERSQAFFKMVVREIAHAEIYFSITITFLGCSINPSALTLLTKEELSFDYSALPSHKGYFSCIGNVRRTAKPRNEYQDALHHCIK